MRNELWILVATGLLLGLSGRLHAEPEPSVVVRPAQSPGERRPPEPTAPPTRCRVKDLAQVAGLNSHSLTGFGLVAGLPGSGDSQGVLTSAFVLNLLTHYGLNTSVAVPNGLNRNVAVVAVTAEMPALSRSGDRLEVRVASLGDAKSLDSGTLLSSLLYGPDGKVYASAQGAVRSVAPVDKSNNTKPGAVGLVAGGATISQNLASPLQQKTTFVWTLQQPDFTTARRVAEALTVTGATARATGPQTIEVGLSPGQDPVIALSEMGELTVLVDRPARVVCDERTGTVVAGGEVKLHAATISHRGITIEIAEQGTTVKSLVDALNKAGALPADVIGVITALQQSGALNGELLIR